MTYRSPILSDSTLSPVCFKFYPSFFWLHQLLLDRLQHKGVNADEAILFGKKYAQEDRGRTESAQGT